MNRTMLAKMIVFVAALAAPVVAGAGSVDADDAAKLASLPMQMPNFSFVDTHGERRELADYGDAPAIVLFNQLNGCPIVRQSYPYLREIRETYAPKGVVFLYISSNPWDTDEAINLEMKDYSVDVPVLRDEHRALAHALSFERSAEVFVVDPKTWAIAYRGMADDRFAYGLQRMSPKKFWLRDALDAQLGGKLPVLRKTIAKGCMMDLELYGDVDYEDDILPLIRGKLSALYDAAPATEDEARAKASEIVDALLLGRLASGGADDTLSFTEEEAQVLLAWIYGGATL